ncbi:MAG TPA: molecular chaperone DnaK [Deltaproteobacteria bacterium]|nr:molecular chaperone DnaK [Deltaproteobacteria bacterium]HCP47654.1 molecular chaperone DnaK [Deltaproteobacteria bacterium]
MDKVIGIDLGTTNSCVAVYENTGPVVVPNRGGYQTTPSIVAFADNGKRLVGHIAKRQAVTNAQNTIFSVKRLIGRQFDSPEVQKTKASVPYEIKPAEDGQCGVSAGGRDFTVQEVSAFILMEMKKIASDYLGEDVTKTVVTVPAYFNDAQRTATKQAGQIAGLDVIRIINEPTAAALAYGASKGGNRNLTVFDLGGGTFDVSVLSASEGVFEVVSTSGDTFLGGADFDNRVIDYLAESFMAQHGMDLREDRVALQRLREASENAKCELSFKRTVEVTLPFIATKDAQPIHLQQSLSRGRFEELVGDLVDRCIDIVKNTVDEANMTTEDVHEVILVGGQTRTPMVQQAVETLFQKPFSRGSNPDEIVALGAAVQGQALVDETSDMLLLDVTPMSLGIATAGGRVSRLIPKNTTIPTQKKHSFTTVHENQSAVKIIVLQGESEQAADNKLLGEFLLSGIRPAPKGVPDIEVTFEIDADGIVAVRAKDKDTGKEQSITVAVSGGLSDADLNRMIGEREEYEINQKQDDSTQELFYEVEKVHQKVLELLPSAEAVITSDELHAIMDVLAEAKAAMNTRDQAQLKAVHGKLSEANESLNSIANQ